MIERCTIWLFKSYLSERSQCVYIGIINSSTMRKTPEKKTKTKKFSRKFFSSKSEQKRYFCSKFVTFFFCIRFKWLQEKKLSKKNMLEVFLGKKITYGVPKNLIGPLLFLIFINDFPYASSKFKYTMVADDSNLHVQKFNKCVKMQSSNH